MKFLIALAFLAVVSALPPRHGLGHQQYQDYQLEGLSNHQLNLIKSTYNQLIESLNHPAQDENEEEERAINDIVDTINIIGKIIHDNGNDVSDINVYNGLSKPQQSEHYNQAVDALNKPSDSEDHPNGLKVKKVPSIKDDVEGISQVYEVPVDDDNKSSEVFVVDNVLKGDESEPDMSFVNQKDNRENPIIAYNSISAANGVPTL